MSKLPEEIRTDPRFSTRSEARERHAQKARTAQSLFFRYSILFVLSTLVAAVCAGLLLYGIEATPDQPTNTTLADFLAQKTWNMPLLVLQALSLALAAFCGHMLKVRDYNRAWTESRLDAEDGRLALQKIALEIGHAMSPQMFRAAAEAFKGFLDGQMEHLDKSSKRHDKAAGNLAFWGALIAALAALGGVLGGLENKTVLILVALLGVCTPALVAALKATSDASAAAIRAELHRETWDKLNTVKGDLNTFDDAVSQNDLGAVQAFAERVFEPLRADHTGFAATRKTDTY